MSRLSVKIPPSEISHITPAETVKVGIIGLGMRGSGAVYRLSAIPGTKIVALCDIYKDRVGRRTKWLTDRGFAAPKDYSGSTEDWKKLVEAPEVNLVYVASSWQEHINKVMCAMECGKHVVCEVPMVFSEEDCRRIINKAEEKRVHCMLLENCCYGYSGMLALNRVRQGSLGTLVHGEGAYIHDLRNTLFGNGKGGDYESFWRLKWNTRHTGNPYATHGLGPICQYTNIGRGDKMKYLTSVSSDSFGYSEYCRARQERMEQVIAREKKNSRAGRYGMTVEEALRGSWMQGDMNTTVIETEKGRPIMVQHDTTSPRPYSRPNLISGTKGIFKDYPLGIASEPNAHGWLRGKEREDLLARSL